MASECLGLRGWSELPESILENLSRELAPLPGQK